MKIYATYNTRAECLVDTWMFCFAIGFWYAWLRVFGLKVGIDK